MRIPKVAIIILNWNGWEDTIECLESIFQNNYHNFFTIVVDNNSKDDSIKKIHEYCKGNLKINSKFYSYSNINKPINVFEYTKEESERVKFSKNKDSFLRSLILIKNDKNYGFAQGNNVGIKFVIKTNPHYIMLLNNDIVVDKEFLKELVSYAEDNLDVGVIGPKICYYDYPHTLQVTTTKIDLWTGRNTLVGDGEIDYGQYNNIKLTDYVSGACFFIKKDVIDNVGFLDSNFNCYWEDTDYCLSIHEAGYKCIYNPNSVIWHKASKSTNKISGLMSYYMARNMFWVMKKHASKIQYIVFLLFFFGLKIWYIILVLLVREDKLEFSNYIKGVKDGLFEI